MLTAKHNGLNVTMHFYYFNWKGFNSEKNVGEEYKAGKKEDGEKL